MSVPEPPRLVTIDAPWLEEPGVVRVLVHDSGAMPEPHGGSRAPDRPFILEQKDRRLLFFTMDHVQSTMRLDEPDSLVAQYLKKMMAFLLFVPEPRHIVMLGLGGGSLPKFCYRHLPDTRLTVVELNADVIAMRDEFLIPPDDDRLTVVHGDGARYLYAGDEQVDVILVDAFDADGIAPSLANVEFYAQAARRLSRTGVFVMNLNGDPARYGVALAGASAAFGGRIMLLPVSGRHNVVLYGFMSGDPQELIAQADRRAVDLEIRLDLDFPRYLRRMRRSPASHDVTLGA